MILTASAEDISAIREEDKLDTQTYQQYGRQSWTVLHTRESACLLCPCHG